MSVHMYSMAHMEVGGQLVEVGLLHPHMWV